MQPVERSALEIQRFEFLLEGSDGGGAVRGSEEDVLDLVVDDPAAVAGERFLQSRFFLHRPDGTD